MVVASAERVADVSVARSQDAREAETGSKDKTKAKRRKLEREANAVEIKEKNQLPKDAFRVEHLNYKVSSGPTFPTARTR